ncbi:growth-regulating factor 8-like [Bidens hawaiensis]|uniref:growth-regulating factor 8-like n=1 Tax=Bidens hawaiensis TaxID=980011 RepID=UPI004049A6D6
MWNGSDVYGLPINTITAGVMRNTGNMLFTATQWQELERQTTIYKYIMASIPVPLHLLISLSTQPNRMGMGLRFSNGSDPEPWRCRRTDGKKWRCTKEVAPDQKYCERHARKTRPRSRKPVETTHTKANQQTECSDRLMRNSSIPMHQLNNQFPQQLQSPVGGSKRGPIWEQECSLSLSMKSDNNEMEFDNKSFKMAVGMLSGGERDVCEDVLKPNNHWLNQASWACLGSGSGSGSAPGGPLGEALCLGITSTRNEPSSDGYRQHG